MNNKEKKWYFLWRNNNNIFPPEIPRSFVPTGNLCEFHHLVARNFIYSSLIWFENILLTLFYIFPRGDISKFYCGHEIVIQLLWKYPSMEELSFWYLNEYYLTRNNSIRYLKCTAYVLYLCGIKTLNFWNNPNKNAGLASASIALDFILKWFCNSDFPRNHIMKKSKITTSFWVFLAVFTILFDKLLWIAPCMIVKYKNISV